VMALSNRPRAMAVSGIVGIFWRPAVDVFGVVHAVAMGWLSVPQATHRLFPAAVMLLVSANAEEKT